ncbi:DUF2793 domain-containing protein [Xinfangfangia sp. CPCC 101601]|uniref:DUF2793 domain-containing protein n=1 Tax=Pseudogemmobacter lacusdianii TaxID=3069608 RepID=A0ABU0W053_9RHOB|nr:DUF2793 domain-containing protein [Xinfangfangia sp. CPCC 101601]MDQ2067268.1 DUF2793 domain-containing protein [Xinfangfangia sp. CPCC 101601]
MADETDILRLPLMLPSQAQKHVTHNEALLALDALVQLVVLNRDLTVPPALPVSGDRHIVAVGATLDWAGKDRQIAVMTAEGWQFYPALNGWQAQVLAEGQAVVFDGFDWKGVSELPLQVRELGISASPDATNRLALSAPATLLNHAGAGHQLKLNKAAAGDTASLLFQTGFSGRAEMGTAGSDAFSIKVSADGSSFVTALEASVAGVRMDLPLVGTAVTQSAADATAGRVLKVGDYGLGAAAGTVIYGRANLLGPVSQSSGAPTGAVIERGTGANGDYVRFADGTQICSLAALSLAHASTALAGLFRSADVTWSYPAAFAAAPVVSGAVDDGDCWLVTQGAPGASAAVLRALAAVSKSGALNLRIQAVGRWF